MNSNTLSRRRLLASVPAVAAGAVPAAATALGGLATNADPVFAAIETHREAVRELAASYEAQSDVEEAIPDGHPHWSSRAGEERHLEPPELIAANARVDAAGDRHADALFHFLTTPPVTMAGAIAALDYGASPMFPDQKGANNKQTIQLDGSMSGNDELIEASAQFPAMIAEAVRNLLAA
jgi:hypothetical protein